MGTWHDREFFDSLLVRSQEISSGQIKVSDKIKEESPEKPEDKA